MTSEDGAGERTHLGSRTTLKKTFTNTVVLEIAKQTVGAFIRLQKMSEWTLKRGQPPQKRKKRPLTTD
jgi:hypothetical protein